MIKSADPMALVQRLRRLDCCAVSDALDQLGLAGVVTGLPHRSGELRLAGRVITVKLGLGTPTSAQRRHLGTTAIEQAGADDVIVIEQRSGVDAGSWGGLLSLGAKVRGVAGVIADGPVRDIDEARAMGFTIFSTGLTSRTARGRVMELGTNIPITIGSVCVEAGDFVIADSSAVIFLEAARAEAVIDAAEEISGREAVMSKAILGGARIGEVMGGAYEYMLKR